MNREKREQHPNYLPLNQLHIDDCFWNRYTDLVTEEIIPYQYRALHDLHPDAEPSYSVQNLRIAAGMEGGSFQGFVFQDTDVAKWLEAAAFSLSYKPDPLLEQAADQLIGLVAKAQEENGYLDTYFTIGHPGQQFCNLKEGHELYTAGHFIEAAVAYYQVTGKDFFLNRMRLCADNICWVFHTPEYQDAVPGHEEIELALCKLADATGEEKYRDMALEFVDRRGTTDYLSREHTLPRFVDVWHDRNPYLPPYGQAHLPVREQTTAEGHAVRALYLYSAMADLALSYGDEGLKAACQRLYDNIVQRRMYVTGGIGSSGTLERFTADYDLPNDSNYSESCASIALAMFCQRMTRLTGEAKYMDTAELALYNTVLAGVSMDGKRFFYVNPLEVVPRNCLPGTDKGHVRPVRQKWFGCACCPPNIARTLASLAGYLFLQEEDALWVGMYVSGSYETRIAGVPVTVEVTSKLPWEGKVRLHLTARKPMAGSLRLRVPDYAEDPAFAVNGSACAPQMDRGFALLPLSGTDFTAELTFPMPARFLYASPMVPSDTGKCCVKKGPLVYCLEEADNGEALGALVADVRSPLRERWEPELLGGTVVVEAEGWRLHREETALYSPEAPALTLQDLRFVPYCFWGNRKEGEMAVWTRYSL